jgi:predicted HicB family RNase H-like nuclease
MTTPERKAKPPSAELHIRLPATHYDQIFALATKAGQSIPEWVRDALRQKLKKGE